MSKPHTQPPATTSPGKVRVPVPKFGATKQPPKAPRVRVAEILRDNWKVWAVASASLLIMIGIAWSAMRSTLSRSEKTQTLADMALIAGMIHVLDAELGGCRIAPEARSDSAMLDILRTVAQGGVPERNSAGEILRVRPPEPQARRPIKSDLPKRAHNGQPIQFRFDSALEMQEGQSPTPASSLPSVVVQGIGALRPPTGLGVHPKHWTLEGDTRNLPYDSALGGGELPITLLRPNAEPLVIYIFFPLHTST